MSDTKRTQEAEQAPRPDSGEEQESVSRSATREALLDAAEILFADGGIQGTSLRAITSEAGANLAAVNYHFGNKEGLVRAVFERRIGPVNEQRLQVLDEIEATSRSSDLDAILRAFLAPVLSMGAQPSTAHFKRLLGRIFTEPGDEMRSLLKLQFEDVANRFGAALSRALPGLPRDVLIWRFHFMLGSMVQMAHNGALVVDHSGGVCDPSRAEEVIERMVECVAAGFRAPAAKLQSPAGEVPRGKPAKAKFSEASAKDEASGTSSEGIFAWEDGF